MKLFATLVLITVIVMCALTYLFNLYPGGYSLEMSNKEAFIDKGTQEKEHIHFQITKNNEFQIALLESKINELKLFWYTSIILIATMILYFADFYINKKNKIVLSIISILLITLILASFNLHADRINIIENLIKTIPNI